MGDKRCRVCLCVEEYSISLDAPTIIEERSFSYSDILTTCCSIKVFKDDGKPQNICIKCAYSLRSMYDFKKLCSSSDLIIQNELDKLANNQLIQNIKKEPYTEVEVSTNNNTALKECCSDVSITNKSIKIESTASNTFGSVTSVDSSTRSSFFPFGYESIDSNAITTIEDPRNSGLTTPCNESNDSVFIVESSKRNEFVALNNNASRASTSDQNQHISSSSTSNTQFMNEIEATNPPPPVSTRNAIKKPQWTLRKFKCDLIHDRKSNTQCWKRFATKGALLQHMRGTRNECYVCQAEYSSNSELRAHLKKTHANRTCDFCLRRFISSASLNEHLGATRHFW